MILNIAAREHPRAGSKQVATYQAVAAHQICAAQLLHKLGLLITSLARSYTLSTMHHQRKLCGAHLYSLDPKLRYCYYCTYFLAHTAAACLLHFSLSLYFSHLCLFSTKHKLAKLKRLLRVQPNGRQKDEPQRGFISVRYYEV